MVVRRRANQARTERLTASPSTLPAAGGKVRLRAHVRNATRCRFSSGGALHSLPATAYCASGRASVTVKVPKNRRSTARSYVLYLTVRGPRGGHRTVRHVIFQRGRSVTAASGTRTRSSTPLGLQSAAMAPPVITAQPADLSVAAGAPVSLSATASGNPVPTVQWQVSADGGATWASTSPTFAANAGRSGYEYRAVFTNADGSATSAAATLTVLATATQNFSGYIAYAQPGQSFTAVSASWTVPTVTCQAGATSWAAQWPGIGDGASVQQDGTEADCVNGSPVYWAWYEMYGDTDPAANGGYAIPLAGSSYPVSPGDAMTGSVAFSNSTWQFVLVNATQNWTFQTQVASPTPAPSQASAEWMVEDPDGCTPQCQTLAQFSPVHFSGATATANGQSGPISSFPVTAMAMNQHATMLATPGPLDVTGGAFTDTWLAS
jgi:hypothetical protein